MSIPKKGDKVTIQGIKRRKDGTWTRRCKPGNETPMVVVKVTKRGIRPAILGKQVQHERE